MIDYIQGIIWDAIIHIYEYICACVCCPYYIFDDSFTNPVLLLGLWD